MKCASERPALGKRIFTDALIHFGKTLLSNQRIKSVKKKIYFFLKLKRPINAIHFFNVDSSNQISETS